MQNMLNKSVVRTYKVYHDEHPDKLIAVLTVKESLTKSEGNIDIIEDTLSPIDLKLFSRLANNINGVLAFLNDRAMPPNRMFFEEYCKEHGYNVHDLNDRLKISGGRNCSDDYYLVMEEKTECTD